MNFTTTKLKKKRKGKPKRANLNKWEKLFIERHGIEIYDKIRDNSPEMRIKPYLWKTHIKMEDYFGSGFLEFLLEDIDEFLETNNNNEGCNDEQT